MLKSSFVYPFATAAVAGTLALSGCHEPETDARLTPPLVRVAQVNTAAPADRSFTGIVSARVQSDLGFRVAGKIAERLVDPGQEVKRGQPLMRIDRTDLALATVARNGAVEAARAHALQTGSDERRYRGLVAQGAVSALTYDQAKAAAEAAAAELRAAVAQAEVARNEAGYSVLAADADGVVMETLGEPGQVVAAGQTVVKLAHAGPREAVVHLPETLRPVIGSSAETRLYGSKGSVSVAKLRQLSNSSDPRTRTFEARYVLQGDAAVAPLGSTIRLLIPDSRGESAIEIPLSAVFDNGRETGVWLIDGPAGAGEAGVVWQPVKLAGIGQETAMLETGLQRGARFVTLGAHLLHPGQRVRLSAQGTGTDTRSGAAP